MSEKRNCDKHGEYEVRVIEFMGRTISRSACPDCMNEAEAERKAADENAERARELLRWQASLRHACIPERFLDRTLDSYIADTPKKRAALDFAASYADGFKRKSGRGALLLGLPGTGKTHLSIGIAMRLMESGYSALFLTVMRAIRRIKEAWGRDADMNEADAIESLVFPDLLILDEIGVQFGSETEKLLLFEVLNERYEQRKSTLLLSNLSLGEVKAYLGERVFDRMREDGGRVIVFDWESYRSSRKLEELAS